VRRARKLVRFAEIRRAVALVPYPLRYSTSRRRETADYAKTSPSAVSICCFIGVASLPIS
jgi:hypothetical protein